jgi:hypothetical protein
MTAPELTDWMAFETLNGPILIHERMDMAAALIGTGLARLGGDKRTQPADLMPRWDRDGDLQDAWAALEGIATRAGH